MTIEELKNKLIDLEKQGLGDYNVMIEIACSITNLTQVKVKDEFLKVIVLR